MINKLHPLTITENLKETAEFYIEYFDFEEIFTSDWYLQLSHKNGAELGIMLPNLSNQPDILHKVYSGTGIVFTFETEDAGEMYSSLKSKKAPIVYELKDEKWGQRHFILQDPAGVYVDVVQYL